MRALKSIVTRKTHLKLQLGRMQLKTPHLTQTNARSKLVVDFPFVQFCSACLDKNTQI